MVIPYVLSSPSPREPLIEGVILFFLVMGYAITLLCAALVSRNRGNTEIWSSTVRDTRFLERHEVVNVSIEHGEELPVGKQY